MKIIGKKIRALREQQQFTQQQLADELGISKRTYSRIESGEANLNMRMIAKICEILKEDPARLLALPLSHPEAENIPELIRQYESKIKELDFRLNKTEKLLNEYICMRKS